MEKVICIMFDYSYGTGKLVENRVNEHLKNGWIVKDFKVCTAVSNTESRGSISQTVFCFVLKK